MWLLFLMKDMKNLDLASSKLAAVEKGFRKAHGEGLQRLTTLKGEYCAEKLLYVRLHLLQVCTAERSTRCAGRRDADQPCLGADVTGMHCRDVNGGRSIAPPPPVVF